MALSYQSVQKAYGVLHELSKIIPIEIPSFPEDMQEMEKRTPLKEQRVYGYGKKADGGWENLVFFVSNPSQELRNKFDELRYTIPNTSFSKQFVKNNKLWMFGWL